MALTDGTFTARHTIRFGGTTYRTGDEVPGSAFPDVATVQRYIQNGHIDVGSPEGGGVTPESDADGERIPIRDANGVIKGYVGHSASVTGANGIVVWVGDEPWDWESGIVMYGDDNGIEIYGPGGAIVSMSFGGVNISTNVAGELINIGRPGFSLVGLFNSAPGIDGTDTPTTVAELADVLVALGVIASHTIA